MLLIDTIITFRPWMLRTGRKRNPKINLGVHREYAKAKRNNPETEDLDSWLYVARSNKLVGIIKYARS